MDKVSFHRENHYEWDVRLNGKSVGFATRAADIGLVDFKDPKADWWVVGKFPTMIGPCKTRREAASKFVTILKALIPSQQ